MDFAGDPKRFFAASGTGQGGGQNTLCCWLQRWQSPSDGCSPRGPCSSSSTYQFAMLQEGAWEGHTVRCCVPEKLCFAMAV